MSFEQLKQWLQKNWPWRATTGAAMLTKDEISDSTITAAKMNVSELSAISADLGTITAGTVTGATIRTAASGQRVELDSTNGLRGIDGSETMKTQVTTGGELKALELGGIDNGLGSIELILSGDVVTMYSSLGAATVEVDAGGDVAMTGTTLTFNGSDIALAGSVSGTTITLAKITPGGADGSLTFSDQGVITAYTAPT